MELSEERIDEDLRLEDIISGHLGPQGPDIPCSTWRTDTTRSERAAAAALSGAYGLDVQKDFKLITGLIEGTESDTKIDELEATRWSTWVEADRAKYAALDAQTTQDVATSAND